MDPITQQTALASAGGKKDPVYVDDVFSTTLYTGNNSNQTISTGIDNTEKSLLWFKGRNYGFSHMLFDTVRGKTRSLSTQVTNQENPNIPNFDFTSDGFTLQTGGESINNGGLTMAAWNFKAQKGFFDVVTYTGNSTAGRTVAHSLGSVPGMIIVKCTNHAYSWNVFHRSLTGTHYLELETTGSAGPNANIWNNTNPTSTHFTLGNSVTVNETGKTYVAYVFAHDDAQFGTDSDESIIKCGTYTGTNAAGLQTVDVGFEPQFVLIKNSTTSANWFILDSIRGAADDGNDQPILQPNTANAETSPAGGGLRVFITNNGFGWRDQTGNPVSGAGNTFIYMAIRRPNKPPELATEVFAMDTGKTSSTTPTFDSPFVVDAAIEDNYFHARIMGAKSMFTYLGDRGEQTDALATWDSNLGWAKSYNSSTLSYMFKRAPGFMDVVTYTGTGVTRTINHNLTVKPELMLFKSRSAANNWVTYDKVNGATNYMSFNMDIGTVPSSSIFNNTEPTSSVFTVSGASGNVNGGGGTYIAFLFATLPGISKVGSYTGTGNAINVNCGFTNGARFILIKRTNTNTTGDWYYWDTFNGIVSGNDSYNRFNLSPSRVTGTDYIDPLSTGFTVTSSAPAALNTSGGTYLFLAIA